MPCVAAWEPTVQFFGNTREDVFYARIEVMQDGAAGPNGIRIAGAGRAGRVPAQSRQPFQFVLDLGAQAAQHGLFRTHRGTPSSCTDLRR